MEALAAEAAAAMDAETTTTSYGNEKGASRALNTLSNPSSSRAQRKREPKGELEEGVNELEQLKPLFRYTVSAELLLSRSLSLYTHAPCSGAYLRLEQSWCSCPRVWQRACLRHVRCSVTCLRRQQQPWGSPCAGIAVLRRAPPCARQR